MYKPYLNIKRNVVVIDDEPINCKIITRHLSGYNFNIHTLYSAVDILSKLDTLQPDIILLDLMMPDQDGFKTLEILSKSQYSMIPVIILSGNNGENILAKCLKQGAVDFIPKPVNKIELIARINSVLKLYDLQQSLNLKILELEKINTSVAKELDIAKKIQLSLTGSDNFISDNFTATTSLKIANQLGGDFFDIKEVEDNVILGFVADVSGHGVSSALVVMMLKALIDTHGTGFWSPSELLDLLHDELFGTIPKGYFVAINHFHYNKKTGKFTFVNAGLYDIMVIRADQKVEYYGTRCFALAFIKNIKYEENSITLYSGDKVIISTDGLHEALNDSNEMYGQERLKKSIIKHSKLHSKELLNNIFNDRKKFIKDTIPDDDTTIMIIEITQNQ